MLYLTKSKLNTYQLAGISPQMSRQTVLEGQLHLPSLGMILGETKCLYEENEMGTHKITSGNSKRVINTTA